MNSYHQIKVTAPQQEAERANAVMTAMDFIGGLMIEDYSDIEGCGWDYVDESLLSRDKSKVEISGYVAEGEDIVPLLEQLKLLLPATCTVDVSSVAQDDWANNWRKYYKPIRVGNHLVIKPSWEAYDKQPDDVIVELDPGMAFGTGTHETTRMCMALLEQHVNPGTRVLDVGCGSGILSIAALLLGAESATGVDIDPVAAQVAAENGARNGFTPPRFQVLHGNLLEQITHTYPVVVANIIADVIIPLSGDVAQLLEPGGVFICSGIIEDREEDVRRALLDNGYEIIERKSEGEWVAMVSIRKE